MEFQAEDPDFSVSWLLGLQPHQSSPERPAWTEQFESSDKEFSVSWLLGLVSRPYSSTGPNYPPWAKAFQSTNPSFSVSWLLGLRPRRSHKSSPQSTRSSGSKRRVGLVLE